MKDDMGIEDVTVGFHEAPPPADWQCHLFGSDPKGKTPGFVLRPTVGNVPNWFIRWMMKICLGCTWEKLK